MSWLLFFLCNKKSKSLFMGIEFETLTLIPFLFSFPSHRSLICLHTVILHPIWRSNQISYFGNIIGHWPQFSLLIRKFSGNTVALLPSLSMSFFYLLSLSFSSHGLRPHLTNCLPQLFLYLPSSSYSHGHLSLLCSYN